MKKYVITGGPSSGKSTLLRALEKKGFAVIEESAKEVIFLEKQRGVNEPWLEETFVDFQTKIVELQLKKEAEIPSDTDIVFIDRGVPDVLAYFKHRKFEPSQKLLECVKNRKYEKVFLLEQLPVHKKADYRVEDEQEAKRISQLIKQSYQSLGYDLISVPPLGVRKRVEFVLKNM
ncbi:hypothetical protein AYK26_07225 [Euryarchaeota archaeon SM23-78]|nr:MAG: hypothetical protein AYK26_07225 [Euryarchaeota archaeon SM23-78]